MLNKCKNCGSPLSSDLPKCNVCGVDFKNGKAHPLYWQAIFASLAFPAFAIIIGILKKNSPSKATRELAATVIKVSLIAIFLTPFLFYSLVYLLTKL